jgi:hypothetical protein
MSLRKFARGLKGFFSEQSDIAGFYEKIEGEYDSR